MDTIFASLPKNSGSVPGVLLDSVEYGAFKAFWQAGFSSLSKFNTLSMYFRENSLFCTLFGCVLWSRPIPLMYNLLRCKWPLAFGETTEHFILHEGPASTSRELLLAVGVWADQLHKEIWVYDKGWSKDSGLWQEIQKARWEDVILEFDFKTAIQKDVLGFFSSKDMYKALTLPWKVTLHLHSPLQSLRLTAPSKARTYFVWPTRYKLHSMISGILLTSCREWKNHFHQSHHERVSGKGLLPHVRQIS